MAQLNIFLQRDVPPALVGAELARFTAAHPKVAVSTASGEAAATAAALRAADVVVTDLQLPASRDLCPNARWIQLVSAGANQVAGTWIEDSAVAVTTSSGLHGVPIAQFVTGGLLSLVHHFPAFGVAQAQRRWPADRWALRAEILRGQTAGVIGYGSIGRECARQLHALGLRILALDPADQVDRGYTAWPGTGDPTGTLPERWFQPTELRAFLPQCDVVVVAAPYTRHTAGMIGADELALLKPGARIVIISRGGIVQELPLVAALREGRLAGAVVDCYVQEPPPSDHAFYEVPNLIMTPHMAGAYEGFWAAFFDLFAANVHRFSKGEPLLNQANKRLGY
jgi:phosphoglycerate dehydrogenase-like enzyme